MAKGQKRSNRKFVSPQQRSRRQTPCSAPEARRCGWPRQRVNNDDLRLHRAAWSKGRLGLFTGGPVRAPSSRVVDQVASFP